MNNARPVRVMMVDDHALFRAGLRQMLSAQPGIEVVAEAGSAEDAFAAFENDLPDVVLLDIGLPGMGGIAALSRLRQRFPKVKTLMLSMHRDQEYVARALEAGASGYLLKETCSVEELSLAIASAHRGQVFISSSVAGMLVSPFVKSVEPAHELSIRQEQVLVLLAQGLAAKEVASRLGLSVKTVDSHRAALMEKLGLRTLAQLVLFAVRNGLISAVDGSPFADSSPATQTRSGSL